MTLEQAYIKTLEKIDKIGSLYLPMDEFLNRFESTTNIYLYDLSVIAELSQDTIDLIRPIIVMNKKIPCSMVPGVTGVVAPIPDNYFKILSIIPIADGDIAVRKYRHIRHGEINVNKLDPFETPTIEYPLITQYENYYNIDSGTSIDNIISILLSYIKKPTIANINQPNEELINLPIITQELLINKLVTALFSTVADQRVQIPSNKF